MNPNTPIWLLWLLGGREGGRNAVEVDHVEAPLRREPAGQISTLPLGFLIVN